MCMHINLLLLYPASTIYWEWKKNNKHNKFQTSCKAHYFPMKFIPIQLINYKNWESRHTLNYSNVNFLIQLIELIFDTSFIFDRIFCWKICFSWFRLNREIKLWLEYIKIKVGYRILNEKYATFKRIIVHQMFSNIVYS